MNNFRKFLNEDAMGGAPPMGGAPGGDMGAPPPGGAPPMGMDPMGGMGGAPPMGGMGDPMGGGGGVDTPPIPQFADVWDVLDAILNNKPLEEPPPPPPQQEQPPAGGEMPQDPMGAGMGMGGMEQQPMGQPPQGQPNLMQ